MSAIDYRPLMMAMHAAANQTDKAFGIACDTLQVDRYSALTSDIPIVNQLYHAKLRNDLVLSMTTKAMRDAGQTLDQYNPGKT